ncbi:hypothetical protein N665_0244s0026 [Sinapis alba]|nr:hypothetical protein N665_0244s0026 [Sinapis alba]
MDDKTMRIRITSEKIRDKMLRRGMWNIAGLPMGVSKWSPDVDHSNANFIPLWVHLTNVPMSMYSCLENTDEKGEEMDKEQIEQVEEIRSEEADDIYQSIEEESVETNKKGRARQILPRLSKTNQRVVISETSDHVKDMRRDQSIIFGCLIETIVKENKAEKIVGEVFKDLSFMANYEYNRLGRLWILWRSSVRMTPVYKSAQLTTSSILLPGEKEEKDLWKGLRSHCEVPMFKNKKWMLMRDYNEILDDEEHSGFEDSPRILLECFNSLREDQWKDYEALYHSTSAMFRLTKCLKALKQPLRALSKIKLGDFPKQMRESESTVMTKWKQLADLEEELLKQRSKIHWFDIEDGNNKFFHSSAKIREVRNAIHEILRDDGSIAMTDQEI